MNLFVLILYSLLFVEYSLAFVYIRARLLPGVTLEDTGYYGCENAATREAVEARLEVYGKHSYYIAVGVANIV